MEGRVRVSPFPGALGDRLGYVQLQYGLYMRRSYLWRFARNESDEYDCLLTCLLEADVVPTPRNTDYRFLKRQDENVYILRKIRFDLDQPR